MHSFSTIAFYYYYYYYYFAVKFRQKILPALLEFTHLVYEIYTAQCQRLGRQYGPSPVLSAVLLLLLLLRRWPSDAGLETSRRGEARD